MSSVLLRGVPVRRVSHAYVRTYLRGIGKATKEQERYERKENERNTRILSDERGENIEGLADLCASAVDRKIKIHESSRERDAR